jgi:hypothetical protein
MERSELGAFLHSLYRKYVGPVQDSRDVYVGFGLFFAGVGLVVVSIATFLWSTTFPLTGSFRFVLRELSVVTGAVGVPLVLFGVTALLPVSRKIGLTATVGVGLCVAATVRFIQIYPQDWYQASGVTVTLYALGAVVVVATAGTALSGYRVERATVRTEAELSGDPATADESTATADDTESFTEADIREDIEAALDDADLNWGGVGKDTGEKLTLTDSSLDDSDVLNSDNVSVTESRGGSVDDAVAGLKNLRGGETKTATSDSDTAEQANALAELRTQQQEKQEAETEPERSLLERVRSILS